MEASDIELLPLNVPDEDWLRFFEAGVSSGDLITLGPQVYKVVHCEPGSLARLGRGTNFYLAAPDHIPRPAQPPSPSRTQLQWVNIGITMSFCCLYALLISVYVGVFS